jgi:hypothetical protein
MVAENKFDKKKIILVTGSHRSGTTWVGKTIAYDKNITYVHEPFNINDEPVYQKIFTYKFKHFYACIPYCREEDENEVYKAFKKLFSLTNNPFDYALKICIARPKDFKIPLRFFKYFFENYFNKQKNVLLKDPAALFAAPWLYEKFHCQVICTTRHPLAFVGSQKKWNWDVAVSNKYISQQEKFINQFLPDYVNEIKAYSTSNPDFIERACFAWNIYNRVVLSYKQKYPDWMFYRYEDLAENPTENFKEIFQKLGFPYTDQIVRKINKVSVNSNIVETKTLSFQTRNSASCINTWKNRLTEDEINKIIALTNDTAKHFYPEGLNEYNHLA